MLRIVGDLSLFAKNLVVVVLMTHTHTRVCLCVCVCNVDDGQERSIWPEGDGKFGAP